jgi:hypothetical protein
MRRERDEPKKKKKEIAERKEKKSRELIKTNKGKFGKSQKLGPSPINLNTQAHFQN